MLSFGGEPPARLTLVGGESAWDVLEQFGLDLQQFDQPGEQVRLLVECVYDGLGADAVYWSANDPARGLEQIGALHLPGGWCRTFTARIRSEAPPQAASILRSFLDPGAKPMSPWPCSAALVRLGKADGDWLAALSFHPRRLFGQTDLKIMLLARRMLLNHRVQVQRAQLYREQYEAALQQLRDGRSG